MLKFTSNSMLVLWLDEEMKVVEVLNDETRRFAFVHGQKNLFHCRVAVRRFASLDKLTGYECED